MRDSFSYFNAAINVMFAGITVACILVDVVFSAGTLILSPVLVVLWGLWIVGRPR